MMTSVRNYELILRRTTAFSLQSMHVNGKPLEVVEETKLLGLTITSDLKWNNHVSNIVSKFSKRLYILVQLKRAKVPKKDTIQFYTTCIRPVLEYASAVFHYSLPHYT